MSRVVSIRFPARPIESDFFLAYPDGEITITKGPERRQLHLGRIYEPKGWFVHVCTHGGCYGRADASTRAVALQLAIGRHEVARHEDGRSEHFQPSARSWATPKKGQKVYL